MFTSTFTGAVYERLRLYRAAKRAVAAQPAICADCGIDLPNPWHWDGCALDPRTHKAKR